MILLDTHVWFWSLTEPDRLSKRAYDLIERTPVDERAIASISIWEFAMMAFKGRIQMKMGSEQWLKYATEKTGIQILELTPSIAIESCQLPGSFHADPADRIIVATARINGATLITKDKNILSYPYVNSIW